MNQDLLDQYIRRHIEYTSSALAAVRLGNKLIEQVKSTLMREVAVFGRDHARNTTSLHVYTEPYMPKPQDVAHLVEYIRARLYLDGIHTITLQTTTEPPAWTWYASIFPIDKEIKR